jgi:hypothetical protein
MLYNDQNKCVAEAQDVMVLLGKKQKKKLPYQRISGHILKT